MHMPSQCVHRNVEYSYKECGFPGDNPINGYLKGQPYILIANVRLDCSCYHLCFGVEKRSNSKL